MLAFQANDSGSNPGGSTSLARQATGGRREGNGEEGSEVQAGARPPSISPKYSLSASETTSLNVRLLVSFM